MSQRQVIRRRLLEKKMHKALTQKMELPGEPHVWSIQFPFDNRQLPGRYFNRKMFASLIKCHFPAYWKDKTPVVVIVRFYVSAPEAEGIGKRALNAEKTPAVKTHELCDYLIHFLYLLHNVVISNYRQIVKIDAEKYYSSNPRTVFQFMRKETYDAIENNHPLYASSEEKRTPRIKKLVQPECAWDEATVRVRQDEVTGRWIPNANIPKPSVARDHALQAPSPFKLQRRKAQTAQPRTARRPARRGQPGEVCQ